MKKALLILLSISIGGAILFAASQYVKAPAPDESEAVRDSVIEFGTKLKMVSLLATDEHVAAAMDAQYAEYVSPELLTYWKSGGSSRLGRLTSSPSPDRIEVTEVTRQLDNTYTVEGTIIETTSADDPLYSVAATQPVRLVLEKIDGKWLIVSAEKGAYSQIPHQETRTGVWECVPHKPGVPPTEECITGIAKDASDGHLILDLSIYQAQVGIDFSAGDHVKVTGVLVPANQLSTNQWQKYDIDGIMQVTSIEKI